MFMPAKKKIPKFLRPNYGRSSRKRIKGNWRRQRGIDNKKRIKMKHMGKSPSIGYGQDRRIRSVHPAGKRETLVSSMKQLVAADGSLLIRIAGGVGMKLKQKLLEEAKKKNLVVLNPGNREKIVKKPSPKKTKATPAKTTGAMKKEKPGATKPAAKTNEKAGDVKKENATPAEKNGGAKASETKK